MCDPCRWACGFAPARAGKNRPRTASRISSSTCCSRAPLRRSAEDIARSVDSIGGNLDAFTAKELVSFNTKVLDEHLPRAFDILSDLVLNPAVPRRGHRERKRRHPRRAEDGDGQSRSTWSTRSSPRISGRAIRSGKPILGTRETLGAFTREMVDNYFRRIYVPSNIIITAAGNLKHEQLVELARQYFEPLACQRSDAAVAGARHARPPGDAQQEVARAGPRVPGRAVLSAGAREALRLLRAEHDAGRRHELAAVPEHPRAPGTGLRGVFGVEPLPRHAAACSVYAGHLGGLGAEVVECDAQGVPRAQAGARSGRGIAARQGPPERLADAQPGIHLQPHGEPGAAGIVLRPVLQAGRAEREHRGGHRRGRSARWRATCFDRRHIALTVLGNLEGSRSRARIWSANFGDRLRNP